MLGAIAASSVVPPKRNSLNFSAAQPPDDRAIRSVVGGAAGRRDQIRHAAHGGVAAGNSCRRQRTDPRRAKLTVSGCAGAVTPTLAVADLLGRVARFQLAQRVVDRGEGYRDALVL